MRAFAFLEAKRFDHYGREPDGKGCFPISLPSSLRSRRAIEGSVRKVNPAYRIRPSDLSCDPDVCEVCDGSKRTVKFVINHNINGGKSKGQNAARNSCQREGADKKRKLDLTTFYGFQMVPIFDQKNLDEGNILPSVFLYRMPGFYRQTRSGSFYIPKIAKKSVAPSYPPERFNGAIESANSRMPVCAENSSKICNAADAISAFDKQLRLSWPWHGYVRNNANPRSTLDFGDFGTLWTIPDPWLIQHNSVKNWIIRYRGTNDENSSHLPSISACVNSSWTGFHLRAFSPDRGAEQPIRAYLFD